MDLGNGPSSSNTVYDDMAKSYIQKATSALHPFKPSMEKEALAALASYVIDRKH